MGDVESVVRAPQPPRALMPPARAPLLHGADAARALDVAERIYASAQPRLAGAVGPPESIGRYGGAALVAEALARAGRCSDDSVRLALRAALVFAPDRLGLFDGAGGLAMALDAVDREHASLPAVRAKLRDALTASLRDLTPGDPAQAWSFDLVGGPAGRAIALARIGGEACDAFVPFARDFANAVERALASSDAEVAAVNLGVAHGVPGVLAALNLAAPGERELARRYVDLLLRCAHVVDGALRWGAVWRRRKRPSARRAWCYQTAGVAAVLADRARIDGDAALHALATNALATVLDDPEPEETWWDAALCHGRGGVASIVWRFADEARLVRHAERLARDVLEEFDERIPLGYRTGSARETRSHERAQFLDAALGIAQFLVDAATAQARRWLPLFGLVPD
jgi:hypothetical protein